ncbi:hypothetical protein CIL03_08365 [Virgibacillus indicus]|uniref:Uncharacterized protein n=1 Tax=Virgibacillus indicus TaxID=2024554 RepID=A0A265NB28_9BACI|nr:transcription termination/antitermination NusG family protein [Virgibacillus indicus]OZU89021.1 hypothetical protein CIL03_08365 [Virgibacillus indicus]
MTFFAVQVHTGSEIVVKEMLEKVLQQSRETSIKAIYAMESYTQVVKDNIDSIDCKNITLEEITSHLYAQRLQNSLSNLRLACEKLKRHKDSDSLSLIKEYRNNIKLVTDKLKAVKNNSRKISSVLPGYILVELDANFHYLPSHLWHLITKRVPKVIAIPSKMNIPQAEIDFFFQQVDLSPEVELQMEETLSYEEKIKAEDQLLYEINKEDASNKEASIDELDNMNTNVGHELANMNNKTNTFMDQVRSYIKNKRITVSMPSKLFKILFKEKTTAEILSAFSSTDLIYRFKRWISTRNEVALE